MMAITSSEVPMINGGATIEKRGLVSGKVATIEHDSTIRTVSPSEYKEAAASLAEAFREDHVVRYAIDTPDRSHWTEEERFNLHRQAFEYITYAHCLNGLVTTVGEEYGCVALWRHQWKDMDDLLYLFRQVMMLMRIQV